VTDMEFCPYAPPPMSPSAITKAISARTGSVAKAIAVVKDMDAEWDMREAVLQLITDDLTRLLRLPFHRFWSQVCPRSSQAGSGGLGLVGWLRWYNPPCQATRTRAFNKQTRSMMLLYMSYAAKAATTAMTAPHSLSIAE